MPGQDLDDTQPAIRPRLQQLRPEREGLRGFFGLLRAMGRESRGGASSPSLQVPP